MAESPLLLHYFCTAIPTVQVPGGLAFLVDLLEHANMKVLVFAHHKNVMDAYEAEMRRVGGVVPILCLRTAKM